MTKLNALFLKPVDRPIEGVIKADDESGLKNEVEEYVITREVEKRLEAFLESYNNYENANGVWVSGFFGSGKSHLLKMLALLLERHAIPDCDIVDEFSKKLKANEFLRGAIEKAVAVPSRSILFNIDQKADIISKGQSDALLAVFVKVFDEACGYYGKQPFIAQFERHLNEDGHLQQFHAAFETHAGRPWDWGRTRINRVSEHIDQAYGEATGATVNDVMGRFRDDYRLSIEDFAEQVNAYLTRQADPKFRLNFYVDEVGQYIANNTKLMTNLQTIAESLATKCRGRSWIIVTAQEDMNSVIGEMGTQESNDFSKIQARFANRMKLASQDVAEVIQERLLKKHDDHRPAVGGIYDEQSNNFKTLFDFSDGTQKYRNYRDRDHFIDCYPFVPYQFDLFQAAIQNLSAQNAFEGKHQSVGERSMLGVFQDVATRIKDHDLNELATFDLMFEGIRSTLKSQIQSAVLVAERNLDNTLAKKLLKALFLVKYVREFKATIRNLSVLMLDRFDADVRQQQKDIQEALGQLESQSYIQRNGDEFEFLTDEEKDVEQEIKNTDVETKDVATELSKVIFDGVIKTKKLRYDSTKQDYSFTRKLDDRIDGREHDLAIHVISPFNDRCGQIDQLKMESMGRQELLVALPPDDRLVRDLLMLKKTAKYISQNVSVTQQESIKRILSDKAMTNKQREEEIRTSVRELLGKARMFVAGNEVETSSEDPATRFAAGFERLVDCVYSNLRLLQNIVYTEGQVSAFLNEPTDSLFDTDVASMSEAETEMLSYVQREVTKGVRTTLKSLVEAFERGTYGWSLPAIQCILAKLYRRGKVEVRSDGNVLEGKALEDALKNTRNYGNVILEPQIEFTASQMRRLKDFCRDFFDGPAKSTDAVALGKEVADRLTSLNEELVALAGQKADFPFLSALDEVTATIASLSKKSYKFFLTEFEAQAETLLDQKEDFLDPIRRFMSGSQAEIYRDASRLLRDHAANLNYVAAESAESIRAALQADDVYRGTAMQKLKGTVSDLQEQLERELASERDAACSKLKERQQQLESLADYQEAGEAQQQESLQEFEKTTQRLQDEPLISQMRDTLRTFEEQTFGNVLNRLAPPATGDAGEATPGLVQPVIPLRTLTVPFDKALLGSKDDVRGYVQALEATLLEEIQQGRRIHI
jgi:hypothetical protein